jgi:hypothetical protein
MAQKGDRRRGKPLNPDLGYAGDPVHHATSGLPPQRIGIRELRQHASVYVERGIARGVIERAEDDGSVLDVDPYPAGAPQEGAQPSASQALAELRAAEEADRP